MTDPQHEDDRAFPTLGLLPRSIWRATRWLWRKTWRFSLALLILLIIAHIIFNFIAGRRLEAELARIRAAGDPLTFSELAPPPVPDSENAAILYQQAFEGLPVEESGKIIVGYISGRLPAGETRPTLTQVEEVLARHEREFRLLEEASLRPTCRFPLDWEAGPEMLFPHLGRMQTATRLLVSKALAEAHRGHSGKALESLATNVRMANHTGEEPTLIAQLVRIAMMKIMLDALPEILTAAPPTAVESRALYDLLDEVDAISPYVTAMKGERVCGLWAFDMVRRDSPVSLFSLAADMDRPSVLMRLWPSIRPVWEPFLKLDEIQYLKWIEKSIRLSEKSLAESKQEYRAIRHPRETVPRYAIVTRMIAPVFARAHEKRDEMIAVSRITQAALALRAYQIEYGEYPDSLEQIGAPWKIHADPFTGKPLVYHREGGGYLIYSVGADMKDDGGTDLRTAREEQAGVPRAEVTYDIPLRMTR